MARFPLHVSLQGGNADIQLSDTTSVSNSDNDIDFNSLFHSDSESSDESPFVLLSIPPLEPDSQATWYPTIKTLRRVVIEPSELAVDPELAPLRPDGSSRAIFSLATSPRSIRWLDQRERRHLMAELSHHEVILKIGRMCHHLCDTPILEYQDSVLTGDAAYVVSAEKQHASLNTVNELIATNPRRIIPQLQTAAETSTHFPLFFTEDRIPSLAAHVVLSTRTHAKGNPMDDLAIIIDLIAINLHSYVDHMNFTSRRSLDAPKLRSIARTQARMVRPAIEHQASISLRAGDISREAYFRMLAIGDTLVPAALYQVGAQLQARDDRNTSLYKDVFGLAIGAALAAVPYGASAAGWVKDIGAAVIDNLHPVRDTVGSMDLLFKRRRDELKWKAAQLRGLGGERNQLRAEELEWYASEMKRTWRILMRRFDSVGQDGRAAKFAGKREEADRRRGRSVVDLVKGLLRRVLRE